MVRCLCDQGHVAESIYLDEQFVLFFIIAFRRFARPSDVLSKLMERYGFVETRIESDPVLARYAQSK